MLVKIVKVSKQVHYLHFLILELYFREIVKWSSRKLPICLLKKGWMWAFSVSQLSLLS